MDVNLAKVTALSVDMAESDRDRFGAVVTGPLPLLEIRDYARA